MKVNAVFLFVDADLLLQEVNDGRRCLDGWVFGKNTVFFQLNLIWHAGCSPNAHIDQSSLHSSHICAILNFEGFSFLNFPSGLFFLFPWLHSCFFLWLLLFFFSIFPGWTFLATSTPASFLIFGHYYYKKIDNKKWIQITIVIETWVNLQFFVLIPQPLISDKALSFEMDSFLNLSILSSSSQMFGKRGVLIFLIFFEYLRSIA